jgi:hypothetical protein
LDFIREAMPAEIGVTDECSLLMKGASTMASLIRKTLNDLLVVPTERDECRTDEMVTAAIRSRLTTLHPDLSREWRARKIESERSRRSHINRLCGFEQHAAQADVEKADRDRCREDREFRVGDRSSRHASAVGGRDLVHAASEIAKKSPRKGSKLST